MRHWDDGSSPGLFENTVPPGYRYREDFMTPSDVRVLLDAMADVAFSAFEMRGVAGATPRGVLRPIVRSGRSGSAADILLPPGLPLGWRPLRRIGYGPDQRVPAWHAYRLAARRTPVRHRRGHLTPVGMPDEVSSIRFSGIKRTAVGSSIGDTRDRTRAAIGLSDDAGFAQ